MLRSGSRRVGEGVSNGSSGGGLGVEWTFVPSGFDSGVGRELCEWRMAWAVEPIVGENRVRALCSRSPGTSWRCPNCSG
jgi:hypothetical protein